jgi:hypothetical protein
VRFFSEGPDENWRGVNSCVMGAASIRRMAWPGNAGNHTFKQVGEWSLADFMSVCDSCCWLIGYQVGGWSVSEASGKLFVNEASGRTAVTCTIISCMCLVKAVR